MLKLNIFFSDCAGLGFVMFMGHAGRSFLKNGNHKAAWLALAFILIWCILYRVARKRA